MHGAPLIPWLARELSKSVLRHLNPRLQMILTGFGHLESQVSFNTCTDSQPVGLVCEALFNSSGFEQASMMVRALVFTSDPSAL